MSSDDVSQDPNESETDEDSAMADEWAALVDEGDSGGGSSGAPARVLNQDEIDNLLGFDSSGDEDVSRSGIHAIINSGMVSYERLPMLEIVFDRLVRMLSTSFRNFTSDNVEVSLDFINSIRFGDYLNSISLPAMIVVFKAVEWDNYGLVVIDSALIYSIVDILLGGRKGAAPMRIEGRPYTTIERTLIERMATVFLHDLSTAFDPLSPVTFQFERLEINPRFSTIARPANAAIIAKLRIDMEDRGGMLELLLPYATLEPVRELLLQMFMGEKFGRDSIWENHLASELWQTDVEFRAVLDEQTLSLKEVMKFEIGKTMMLNTSADSPIRFMCGGVELSEGRMGRLGQNIAIMLESPVSSLSKKLGD